MADDLVNAILKITAVDDTATAIQGMAKNIDSVSKAAGNSVTSNLHKPIAGVTGAIKDVGLHAKEHIGGHLTHAFKEAGASVGEFMVEAAELVGLEELARHGVVAFSNVERSMKLIGYANKATKHDVEALKEEFEELSKLTGKNLEELADKFQTFQSESGLAMGPAKQAFKDVVEAAEAST